MSWFIEALKKYAVFSGRSRRKEYWYLVLFSAIIGFVLGIIDGILGTYSSSTGLGLFGGIFLLAILIPSIAVTFRRLHDTDRSGWWLLIALVPLIGPIVLLIFYLQDSIPGRNRYGLNPKSASSEIEPISKPGSLLPSNMPRDFAYVKIGGERRPSFISTTKLR
jgi:uncharacterized membrane protein YhaH (DUF805 family)